jgi:hypothetical protein
MKDKLNITIDIAKYVLSTLYKNWGMTLCAFSCTMVGLSIDKAYISFLSGFVCCLMLMTVITTDLVSYASFMQKEAEKRATDAERLAKEHYDCMKEYEHELYHANKARTPDS